MNIFNHFQQSSIPIQQIQLICSKLGLDAQTEYNKQKLFINGCILANRQKYYIQLYNQTLMYINNLNGNIQLNLPYESIIKQHFYSSQYKNTKKQGKFRQFKRMFKYYDNRWEQKWQFEIEYQKQVRRSFLNNKIRNRYRMQIGTLQEIYEQMNEYYKNKIVFIEGRNDNKDLEVYRKQYEILGIDNSRQLCQNVKLILDSNDLKQNWQKTQQNLYKQTQKNIIIQFNPIVLYLWNYLNTLKTKYNYSKLNNSQLITYFKYYSYPYQQLQTFLKQTKSIPKYSVPIDTKIQDNILIILIKQLGLKKTPIVLQNYVYHIYYFFQYQNHRNWSIIQHQNKIYWYNNTTQIILSVYPFLYELFIYIIENVIFLQNEVNNENISKLSSVNLFLSQMQKLRKKMIINRFLCQQQQEFCEEITVDELKNCFGEFYNRLSQQQMMGLIFENVNQKIDNNQDKIKLLLTVIGAKCMNQNKQQFQKIVGELQKLSSFQLNKKQKKKKRKTKQDQQKQFQNLKTLFTKISDTKDLQTRPIKQFKSNDVIQQQSDLQTWQQKFDIQINQYSIIDKNNEPKEIETPNFIGKNIDWNKSTFLNKQQMNTQQNTNETTMNASLPYTRNSFNNEQRIIDEDEQQDEDERIFEIERNKKFKKIFDNKNFYSEQQGQKKGQYWDLSKKIVLQVCQNLSNVENMQQLQLFILQNKEIKQKIEQFNKIVKFIKQDKKQKYYCDLLQDIYRKTKKRFKVEWKNNKITQRIRKSSLPQTNLKRKSFSISSLKRLKDLNIQQRVNTILNHKLKYNSTKQSISQIHIKNIPKILLKL